MTGRVAVLLNIVIVITRRVAAVLLNIVIVIARRVAVLLKIVIVLWLFYLKLSLSCGCYT